MANKVLLPEIDRRGPAITDEFRAEYRRYRQQFGPAYFDDALRALCVCSGRLCAVMTTARRGARVHDMLGQRPIPIFDVRGGVWTFLTTRPHDEELGGPAIDIYERCATTVWPGSAIALPTPGNPCRTWICGAEEGELPAFAVVARAVISVASNEAPQPEPQHD